MRARAHALTGSEDGGAFLAMRLESALALVVCGLLLGACAGPGLCERKARYLTRTCSGTSVAVSIDPTCKRKIERCTPGQLTQMEGYVSCLESAGECSLDVMRACQERFPGGVNLVCS